MKKDVAVADVLYRHSKSFHLASQFLAPSIRQRVQTLYAWCRYVDDSIDRAETLKEAYESLHLWRESLEKIYSGQRVDDPVGQALQELVLSCRLPRLYLGELLQGMEMDIVGVFAPDEETLYKYCYRVAGVVGLLMTHVMGVRDPRALKHACHLGIGMQLINIARDVLEDWNRGRLYIPRSWLLALPTVGQALCRESFRPAVQRLLDRADEYLHSGRAGFCYLDVRNRLAVSVATEVYAGIGEKIRRRNYDIYAGRAVVHLTSKILYAARAIVRAFSVVKIPSEDRLLQCVLNEPQTMR
jgi:phytoene synthase